ncbi:hypothetical protein CAAN1_08S04742 [[Candida] anglica]|uniref:RING-type domain-containing protein n=1 Tax=[Candida] anglica TaxID=148631 RepID=A0ABP0E9Y3_9ASCO
MAQPNEGGGPTVINLDLDSEFNGMNELPPWVRDAIDRALSATGLSFKKKSASEEVIENLQQVQNPVDKECPICYDAYVQQSMSEKGDTNDEVSMDQQPKVHTEEDNTSFNDPSLFFPINEVATVYSRFPMKNFYTKMEPSIEQVIPGYTENEEKKRKKKRNSNDASDKEKEFPHIPVKMPGCNHIFGKSCIVEWLKSNVSCPLCRKEVESSTAADPIIAKRSRIREESNFHFQDSDQNEDDLVEYIVNRSTDVFQPFKRPMNPRVTPLTDRYVPQSWSQRRVAGESKTSLNTRDPSLILPRRFPLPDMNDFPFRTGRVSTTPPTATNILGDLPIISTTTELTPTVAVPTSDIRNDPDSELQEPLLPRQLSSMFARGGGPERSSRSSSASRNHPYSRPDEL